MMRSTQSGRRIPRWIAVVVAPVVIATSLLLASSANAVEIGNAARPVAFDCVAPSTYLQQATGAASFSYTVPAGGGLITSWDTFGGTSSGAQVKLAVFRPTGIPSQFTTVGSSDPQTIRAGLHNRANTQIPVLGGETIGLLILSGTHQCALESGSADIGQRDSLAVHDIGSTFTYSDPNPGAEVDVRATVLPAPRTVTLDANKNKLRKGKKVRLSGQVSSVNPQACAFGQTLTLERRITKQKGKPKPIAQLETDAQGRFKAKSKVKASSKFQVAASQTPSCGATTSKQVRVKLGR
jgi:hypothetical protein